MQLTSGEYSRKTQQRGEKVCVWWWWGGARKRERTRPWRQQQDLAQHPLA